MAGNGPTAMFDLSPFSREKRKSNTGALRSPFASERTSGLTTSAKRAPAASGAFKLIGSVVMSNAGLPE
jgi:hypothetical protein